jgi:CheY-like chemotaxis protein
VDIARDGYEGIKKAKSGFFHLVLCDIRMPGLDGLMTIQHIQDFQKKAGAGKSGFIVITAYDSPESRSQACQLGVTDFLMKPFDLTEFLEAVDHSVKPLLKEI